MVFSSAAFLFYFLPAFLLSYLLLSVRWHRWRSRDDAGRATDAGNVSAASSGTLRNLHALLGSLVFYAFGAPLFVYVLIASTALDYWVSHRFHGSSKTARRWWLALSLAVNIGTLLYAKYANFFVAEVNSLLTALGTDPISWTTIALPIGVSFFTFQKISYVVDVARGTANPARSFGDCLLYVALFPQLIAGPIVRYHDIDQQIRSRIQTSERFVSGVQRFTIGLAKKVILANAMAGIADPIFSYPVEATPASYAWLGALAYTLQIYFDFSGYSDMAIGLGRMMGFEFLENFDRPYIAKTFTEFWRRWHISLSRWMREYLYIPLGGNRVSPLRQYRNLWIVFLVSGFWHGAAWNFIAWGAYQGIFLTIDKLFFLRWAERIPAILLRLGTLFLVMMSWVLFRAASLTDAWDYWQLMLFGSHIEAPGSSLQKAVWFDARDQTLMIAAVIICIIPWSQRYLSAERKVLEWSKRTTIGVTVAGGATLLLLAYSMLVLVNSSHNPFIYFRF